MKRKLIILWGLAAWIFLLVTAGISQGRIICVDADANGANDGTSWQNAYNYLQDALEDANSSDKPVEIRVAQGIYRPDRSWDEPNGSGDREATFQLINGVTLKGGYAGFGEPDPNERNIDLYETILSGDLDGNDIEVSDPCDLLKEPTRAENSYHVVTGSGTDANAILDGFTITSGNAHGTGRDQHGGGMYNESGSPILNSCIFKGNSAKYHAGGMYNTQASKPVLNNCTFTENYSWSSGGGIANEWNSTPILVGCTLANNSTSVIGHGGGMHNSDSSVMLIDCKFIGNRSMLGGGIEHYTYDSPTPCDLILINCTFSTNHAEQSGGGIFDYIASLTLVNCIFIGNSAIYHGGGVYNQGTSPMVVNCTFRNNSAGEFGGGMQNWDHSDANLVNCIFIGNSADSGGAICSMRDSSPTLTNSILWDNTATKGNNICLPLYSWAGRIFTSAITVRFSDVEGGYIGVHVETGCDLYWGEGNINADPCFADPNSGDYHLKSQAGRWDPNERRWTKDEVTSPCIDAGDPASPIGLEPFPNGGIINMGAYGGTAEASKSYFGEPVCETIVAGDINGDCKVDFKDFALMAFHWLEEK